MTEWQPIDWVDPDERESVLLHLDAAYREVLDEKWSRLGMWAYSMDYVKDAIQRALAKHGFETAPLYLMAFLDRVAPPAPTNQVEHLRLVNACLTDVTNTVQQHIRYRIEKEGNVHFEFVGRTGSGKSSCALTIADWMTPIQVEEIGNHINLDFGQIGQKLRKLKRGQALVQDELLALAGEGARTTQMALENMMDTLRQSGVSVFTCSPDSRELRTMQAGFEAIVWNTQQRRTLFLVHVDGRPVGITCIPWLRAGLWDAYRVWKEANTERSKAGEFRETERVERISQRLWANEKIVRVLMTRKRPKPKDFRQAIKMFSTEMMTVDMQEAVTEFMAWAAASFNTLEKEYESIFNNKPAEGLKRVALKCYKE